MSMHSIGFIYAIGAAVAWGLLYTIDQKILANTSPLVFMFIVFVMGAVLLSPIIFSQHAALASVFALGKTRLLLILCSVILAILANYMILASIQKLGASLASVLEICYPFFVFLFSFLIFGAELNAYVLAGSILIFLGSAIIMRFG